MSSPLEATSDEIQLFRALVPFGIFFLLEWKYMLVDQRYRYGHDNQNTHVSQCVRLHMFCQLVADFGAVFPNVLWTGPVTLLKPDESIMKGFLAARFGQFIHFFWYESIYCHLLVAINRLIAVSWPLSYTRIFSGKNLVIIISITWLLSLLHTSMYWWYECSKYYDAKIAVWMYRQSLCTQIASRMSYIFGMLMSGLIVLVNTLTFFGLRKQAKKLKRLHNANAAKSGTHSSQSKLHLNFYIQGCITAAILVITLFGFHILPTPGRTSQIQYVLINVVIWETVQTSNAVVLLLFNKPFRKLCMPRRMSLHSTTATLY